jgi:hypothetical protein
MMNVRITYLRKDHTLSLDSVIGSKIVEIYYPPWGKPLLKTVKGHEIHWVIDLDPEEPGFDSPMNFWIRVMEMIFHEPGYGGRLYHRKFSSEKTEAKQKAWSAIVEDISRSMQERWDRLNKMRAERHSVREASIG